MKTKVLFNRKGKLNDKKQAVIEIEVYLSRNKRFLRSTGIFIAPKNWDPVTCTINKTHKEHKTLNFQLKKFVHDLENEFFFSDKPYKTQTRHTKFYTFFEKQVIQITNIELSTKTNEDYARTLNYLKEFAPKDRSFDDIDITFLQAFNAFLIKDKKLHVNTRNKKFKQIKKVINEAIKQNITNSDPFKKGFSVKAVQPPKKSMTLAELKLIENIDLQLKPELEKIRDMYLFQCYTAMRYTDLKDLTSDNFQILENGNIRLSYIQNKVKHIHNKKIEWIITDFWNGKIDMIIKKYLSDDGYFFRVTNQHYNRMLKELQRVTNIKQEITSHLARHTCITLLINDYELGIDKVMLLAGHSRIDQTQAYQRITEKDLANAAQNVNWDK
ncbi:MAG: site-specific integrase [Chitinophagales bacterium]|nr:site-specific integrase [Chitinophagales bacterium]